MSDRVLMVGANEIDEFIRALGPPVRRRILAVLRDRPLNVNAIATELGISQSAAVAHIQALEKAGLVTTDLRPARRGVQKICSSSINSAVLVFQSPVDQPDQNRIVTEMPIGLFFDYEVHATCGIASETGMIGFEDSADAFTDPRRPSAQILWFGHGYIEYRMPIGHHPGRRIDSVAVSVELCSEYPGHKMDWPSDITAWINGVEIGTFTSPGDPGDRPGHLNPSWWTGSRTQYGFLKEWRCTRDGSFVDGVSVSPVTVEQLDLDARRTVTVRFGVKETAQNRGGMNLFGRRFGNHPQDIRMTVEFAERG